MHEMSIAEALLEQVRHHAPAGSHVSRVTIEAGAQQGIDEEALRFAWRAVTAATGLDGAELRLRQLPWNCQCGRCWHQWENADPFCACPLCRSQETEPSGSNVLRILSLEVDDDGTGVPHDTYLECQS